MTIEIKKLDYFLFKPLDLKISNVIPDPESEKYSGFNFKINDTHIKFRKSKLTPKKDGQFVTFWKRNLEGKTTPFDIDDEFDYFIIAMKDYKNFGYLIFPKAILERENCISGNQKSGKCGFRVYADWDLPKNKLGEKTKIWQTEYFINFSLDDHAIIEKFKNILNFKSQ